jgi:hypothetical protein
LYKNGKIEDLRDTGLKYRSPKIVTEKAKDSESYSRADYFFEADEEAPFQDYTGNPCWSIFDEENYAPGTYDTTSKLTFHTNVPDNYLSPLPDQFTYTYQSVHYELERWSMFRLVPEILKFKTSIDNVIKGIRNGNIDLPDIKG